MKPDPAQVPPPTLSVATSWEAALASWLILGRVSTGSRRELIEHLDTALIPHLHRAEVRVIYDHALGPDALSKGPAGHAARVRLGWRTVYAPGTDRELGVLAREGNVWVLFLNASASKRDIAANQNSFVAIVTEIVLGADFRGRDPHAPMSSRPQIFGPYADRFIRDHELGWRLFNEAQKAYAVFKIAGKDPLDTLAGEAQERWMMYAWEGAGAKKTIVSRLTNGELNLYRAGRHGGPEIALLRGYRWEHEPMPDETWRRACDSSEKTLIRHHPEPDPEAWWEVEMLVAVASDPDVTTWKELGRRLGEAGVGSRGQDELGRPLNELQDVAGAAKLLLDPDKLDAYATGSWRYERVGPGFGMWGLPGGHQFVPRWDDDENGSVVYQVRLGLPQWPVKFDAAGLDALKAKWWRNGCPIPEPPGKKSSEVARRPLAGLIRWTDQTHRFEVMAHAGRYELRSQAVAVAPRRADGELADMRHEKSTLVASWREAELAKQVAGLIDDGVERLLTEHPSAEITAPLIVTHRTRLDREDPSAARQRELRSLLDRADSADQQARGAAEIANALAARGDTTDSLAKHDESKQHRDIAARLRAHASDLEAAPLPSADVGGDDAPAALNLTSPAALVEALDGPFGTGPQPALLNRCLATYLGEQDNLRIEAVPGEALRMRLSGTITFTLTDGTTLGVPVSRRIPAKLADTDADLRIEALARMYMRDGVSLETTAAAGRSRDLTVFRRQILEYVGAGQRRPNPNPATRRPTPFLAAGTRIPDVGLRAAAVDAAVPEPRRVLWCAQTGEPAPKGLPRGYAAHVLATYIPGSVPATFYRPWRGPWGRAQVDRYRALAVLTSHNLLAGGMRADHLAACLGIRARDVNSMSATIHARERLDPPTLERVGAWGGRRSSQLPAAEKVVAPIRCRHATSGNAGTCGGLVVAVAFVPEVLAAGAGALCVTCHRAPGSALRFPPSYVEWALNRLARHGGEWTRCGYADCAIDFGAGPGLMWRWNTTTGPVWHGPDCMSGKVNAQAPPRTRQCAYGGCTVDEGYGAGIIADVLLRSVRRWHGRSCESAARRAAAQPGGEPTAYAHCANSVCVIDEGVGPGLLALSRGGSRRWHDHRCRRSAARVAAGAPAAGTISWTECGYTGCRVDEGGGPGMIRNIAGSSGRPRMYHSAQCKSLSRRK